MKRKIGCLVFLAVQTFFAATPLLSNYTECIWSECAANAPIPAEAPKIFLEVVDEPTEECTLEMPPDIGECEFCENNFILESNTQVPSTPDEFTIEDFPIIWQMPELPTGCEITALTMALQYYGYDVDKTTMAAKYLPTVSPAFSYSDSGTLYGPDMRENFLGDPFSDWGYICGAPAIVTAANRYLMEQGKTHAALDLTGTSSEELYTLVAQGTPVVVWVTADRYGAQGWYTESGKYMEWSTQDHGAVLTGYTDDTVMIADPISGMMEYGREQFESVFESRGRQCVIIRENQEVAA